MIKFSANKGKYFHCKDLYIIEFIAPSLIFTRGEMKWAELTLLHGIKYIGIYVEWKETK